MLKKFSSLVSFGWKSLSAVSTTREAVTEGKRPQRKQRLLAIEPLEPRLVLSTGGLVEVGQQPEGGLSGKIVYAHAGHGWTGSGFQRPLLHNMIEDLGNQDQMTFLVDYLFRAGATVVPLRPVGHQLNEVILDNDDSEVTFVGTWSDSESPVYFGSVGDVPYRYATTSLSETAYARYRPDISEAGFYPVYAWTRSGSDRAVDQLYRVQHSGGITEITVNHRRVGNGLVYLGTYHFAAGNGGYVDISNRSSNAGNVVIADMIRFGNGIGDSGQPREDETGLDWIEWHAAPPNAQGISAGEYGTSTVSAPPRYAEFMNREVDGSLSDRVFVSYHSNAGGGRGVTALHNTSHGGDTPNQVLLAQSLAQEVNNDLVAQNGQFEHHWFNRGSNVLYQNPDFNYGEINNSVINNEFDATIVEVAFHDNQLDAELMRDADVRDAVARATYQGLVKYFRAVDGNSTPLVMLPAAPTTVRAETTATSGSVTVSWQAPTANSYNGDAATAYRIYVSRNGYGYDGGTFVAGGGATSHTFEGLDLDGGTYYFRIAAVNAGGESPLSEAVAALPNGAPANVLIVAGFDRLDRQQNPTSPFGGGTIERVRPRLSNSYDYVVQMASAIAANTPATQISSTSNEAVINGSVALDDYDAVFWILGEEFTTTSTFDATEQAKVAAYLNSGGKLFVSGSEIGWDLDSQNNGRSFYNNVLRADYVADDANTYAATGVAGSIFAGISLQFDNGAQYYNVDAPDRIAPLNGSTAVLNYSGGTGGAAAIQYEGAGGQKLVMMAFPFESIASASIRTQLMDRVLEFFALPTEPMATIEYILDNDSLAPTYTQSGPWTLSANPGYNGGAYQFASVGNPSHATWSTFVPIAGWAEVFVTYTTGVGRATDVTYEIDTGNGVVNTSVDQIQNHLQWVSLGTFDFAPGTRSITLNALASSGGSFVIADAVRIVLTGEPADVGDFNSDGVVNGRDYMIWLSHAGVRSGATLQMGDGNFDGKVDRDDLAIWQAQFGLVGPPPGAAGTVAAASVSEAAQVSSVTESATSASVVWPGSRPLQFDSLRQSGGASIEQRSSFQEEWHRRRIALLGLFETLEPQRGVESGSIDSLFESPDGRRAREQAFERWTRSKTAVELSVTARPVG